MKKQILIVGGGFAGINTYKSLAQSVKDNYHITLVDKHNYFLFTPLLHEVATGALDAHHVVEPLEKILGDGVRFIQDTIVAFDHELQVVTLEKHDPLNYDIAVLALGSKTNFFDTPGAQKESFILKDLADAQKLRDHFISVFQEASVTKDKAEQKRLLRTVIVGGGPTGVELAGEAAELFFDTFKKYYRGTMDAGIAKLTIVNGGESLLRPFSASSQKYAQRVLEKKGVEVVNNVRVTEVNEEGAITANGDLIPANTIVWAAGVMPQVVNSPVAMNHDRHRLNVTDTLQLETHKNVFALGDMALAPTEDARGYPMLAQVAKQQGVQTGKNIARLIQEEKLKPFIYKEKGKLASLGQWHAIAEMGKLKLHGPLAWFMWRTIYLINFSSWNKRFKIIVDWTSNLFSPRDVTKI